MDAVEHSLVDGVLKRLRQDGLEVSWVAASQEHGVSDGVLRVSWLEGGHPFAAVVKPRLDLAAVPLLPSLAGGVVVTERVSPALSAALGRAGWGFVDASGNAALSAPGLLVRLEGRRLPKEHSPPSIALPFSRTGLPVTFVLLARGGLGEGDTQRDLAQLAHSSLGSTNRVLKALRTLGHLSPEGGLLRKSALAERWMEAYLVYRDELAPAQRFDSDRWASPKDLPLSGLPSGAVLSSEMAARALGRSIRPETALVYCDPKTRKDLVKVGRLRPSDSGWIELRRTFWDDALFDRTTKTAPDFLVRADLLAEADPRLTELATDWDPHVTA
ncbi:type IV toxin-antitoxin system AbiEi family antitoxin [Ornithinimicrobium sp. W1679]|uniref:type IV toxin-antitoxin system AbiEi family antitoxin n=1 Tax=Ornithinimicrobium sp. W1679 TaxID=3418770 RepID=UPI003CF6094C